MTYFLLRKRKFLVVVTFIMAVCFCSCSDNALTGKKYQGYYHSCENISIEFKRDSMVVGRISSTDFVGHFSDRLYGHYEFHHPYIVVTWQGADSNNDIYKSNTSSPDSIIINESLDTLRLYEKDEEYVLPEYHLYQIDSNASIPEQIGQFCGQTIVLAIIFIIKNFIYIVCTAIILAFVIKWWKKRMK